MTQIVRVYDHWQDATEAVNELKNRGIGDVALVSGPQGDAERASGAEDMVAAIMSAGIEASSARNYAERVGQGGAVVVVNAPFGAAAKVTRILERHGPGETTTPAAAQQAGWSERRMTASDTTAAPLSAALGIPLLRDSTPSSSLAGSATLSSMLGMPELIGSDPFFPLLTERQEPYSSLSNNQQPFASLTVNQKPFSQLSSNQKGSASPIDNPSPLSSWLKIPLLLGDRRANPEA